MHPTSTNTYVNIAYVLRGLGNIQLNIWWPYAVYAYYLNKYFNLHVVYLSICVSEN